MRFHYDKKKDAFYMRFDEAPYQESNEVADGVILDYDKQGKLIGMEILDASRRLPRSLKEALRREELPLSVGAKVSA